VDEFVKLSGDDAFKLKRRLQGQEDRTYGGYDGGNWAAMRAVLAAKFVPGSELSAALLATGDAFLLEHNEVKGRDMIWSDNQDGSGTNWLGAQLMLLRDQLGSSEGAEASWTLFLQERLDLSTGRPLNGTARDDWQHVVRSATKSLIQDLRL